VYSLGTVILFAILSLAIGIVVGVLAFRRFGGQSELAQKLQEAEQQFKDYQADVTEHFEETSRRVNNLTRSYKDVYEYLSSSAMKLTNPQMSKSLFQDARKNLPFGDTERDAFITDIDDKPDFDDEFDAPQSGETHFQDNATDSFEDNERRPEEEKELA